ncbi:MAG: type II toxin-antitoxin system HicA family toxin [Bauldia sp.]
MLTNSRDIIARLRREGFELVSIRGSHHKLFNPRRRWMVIVPHPKSDLPTGTVSAIYRQAGWRKD